MMKYLILLAILSLYYTQSFSQNKRVEDFTAIKKYFSVKSSNGSFLELIPRNEARKENDWLPRKKCYGIYVQTDNFSGATSAIVILSKKYNLEFSDPIKEFRQDADDKYAKRGYVVVYKKKKGNIPKLESILEF